MATHPCVRAAFQGAILEGLSTAPPLTFNKIGAGGGWGELSLKLTEDNRNVFYLGAGTDDPRERHLLSGTGRAKNTFGWASYFRKLTDNVTVASEWSTWHFKIDTFTGGLRGRGAPGRGNVFNVSLAYQF